MSSDAANSHSLLGQFRNVREVFADHVVAKPTGEVFHRLGRDTEQDLDHPRPACGFCPDDDDWQLADPEAVHQAGLHPCRACYKAIFEYLARNPTSPVEARTGSLRIETVPVEEIDAFEPVQPKPKPAPLTALTDQVMVTGGASKVMHAPTPTGPFCGQSGDYRQVELLVVEGHYQPCEDCFTITDS